MGSAKFDHDDASGFLPSQIITATRRKNHRLTLRLNRATKRECNSYRRGFRYIMKKLNKSYGHCESYYGNSTEVDTDLYKTRDCISDTADFSRISTESEFDYIAFTTDGLRRKGHKWTEEIRFDHDDLDKHSGLLCFEENRSTDNVLRSVADNIYSCDKSVSGSSDFSGADLDYIIAFSPSVESHSLSCDTFASGYSSFREDESEFFTLSPFLRVVFCHGQCVECIEQ